MLSLAIYCWANERFTWLVLHPLLPLLLLAGLRRPGDLGRAARAGSGKLGLAVARARASRYTGYTSWWANVENGADPREFLVTTQSAEEVRDVRDEVQAVAERAEREGRDVNIVVDSAEGATFPWAWYFRDLAGRLPRPDARRRCRATPTSRSSPTAAAPSCSRRSPATTAARFPFRVWWVRDYDKMSPARRALD